MRKQILNLLKAHGEQEVTVVFNPDFCGHIP